MKEFIGMRRLKFLNRILYKTGVPPRTRTLTDGFGDRGAAITPGIHIWQ